MLGCLCWCTECARLLVGKTRCADLPWREAERAALLSMKGVEEHRTWWKTENDIGKRRRLTSMRWFALGLEQTQRTAQQRWQSSCSHVSPRTLTSMLLPRYIPGLPGSIAAAPTTTVQLYAMPPLTSNIAQHMRSPSQVSVGYTPRQTTLGPYRTLGRTPPC